MSDWFAREDIPEETKEPLPQRPNPKNEQNAKKIQELEQRIERSVLPAGESSSGD